MARTRARQPATLITKIADARTPLLRYWTGREGLWLPYLKVLLPQRLFDSVLRRGYRLPR